MAALLYVRVGLTRTVRCVSIRSNFRISPTRCVLVKNYRKVNLRSAHVTASINLTTTSTDSRSTWPRFPIREDVA